MEGVVAAPHATAYDVAVGSGIAASASAGGTAIAQALSPPVKPEGRVKRSYWKLVAVVPVVFLICAALQFGFGMFALAGFVAVRLLDKKPHPRTPDQLRQDLAAWAMAMDRWQRFLYWRRCGMVTDAVETATTAVDTLPTWLYRETGASTSTPTAGL